MMGVPDLGQLIQLFAALGIGGVLTAWIQSVQARRKSADDVAVAGLAALNTGVGTLIGNLNHQITHLEGRLGVLSRQNAECEQRAADLTRTVGELRGRLERVEARCNCVIGAE